MTDIFRLTEFSVIAQSTEPLRGVITLVSGGAILRLQLTEDLAHQMCRGLERFLTQSQRPPAARAATAELAQ